MASEPTDRTARTEAPDGPLDTSELIEQTRGLIEEARELRAMVGRILAEQPCWDADGAPPPVRKARKRGGA